MGESSLIFFNLWLCPGVGRPLFPHTQGETAMTIARLCQCPERGDLHFYLEHSLHQHSKVCVNALKGATFISTSRSWKSPGQNGTCVNALNGATFISTHLIVSIKLLRICVNALKGATFISTNYAGMMKHDRKMVSMP